MATRIPVTPSVLTWARSTAGLNRDQAAQRLGVARHTLDQWESGDLAPTIGQLRKAAHRYNRPLAALLVQTPPAEPKLPVTDFRLLDSSDETEWSPALRAAIHRAVNQRDTIIEISETAPDAITATQREFDFSADSESSEAGAALRSFLRLEEISRSTIRRPHEMLSTVVRRVEATGILVMHTRGVAPKEMKGFSLAQYPFPVIALNGSDWPRTRLFTLLHEMAHIGLRSSGLCDMHELSGGAKGVSSNDIERRCNEIAAAALMPEMDFLAAQSNFNGSENNWPLETLGELASLFGASSEAALIRLIDLGVATWSTYYLRKPELDEAYKKAREAQKAAQANASGAPSYYTVKARDLGRSYVASVYHAFQDDAISSREVASYLGIRYDQIPKLMAVVDR